MLHDADRQKLVLPNFQREYVWSLDAQKRLLASLLTDIPMGAVLLLDGEPEDYVSRRVALMQDATPTSECLYLLDGQQRLSTLTSIFSSPFSVTEPWKPTFGLLPAKLRYVWRLRVTPLNGEADVFGYLDLNFPHRVDSEPEDLVNLLSPARILVKDENSDTAWFHPNWKADMEPSERNLEISRAAADEGLVPLWALMSEDAERLADTSLQVIAGMRRVHLQAGADFDKRPDQYEALRRADPTLPSVWRKATRNQLDLAFHSLAERWRTAMATFITDTLSRTTSAIRLQRDDVGRAIAIFEVINQGGTPLTPFDLTVAKNARHPQAKNLSHVLVNAVQDQEVPITPAVWSEAGTPHLESWNIEARDICVAEGSLTTVFKNAFLNLLSLRYHGDDGDPSKLDVSHIKRSAILSIPADGIAENWKSVAESLVKAWAFLQVRCGVVNEAGLRYKLMALPPAYSFMQAPDRWNDPVLHDQLEYWYWSALFGGVFRERQNENAINEVKLVYDWCVKGSAEAAEKLADRKSKALAVSGYSDKDALILKEQDAAIGSDVSYAILQYVLSLGPFDFDPDNQVRLFAWQDVELEDHHIVPLGTAATLKASASALRSKGDDFILNSPLNRTLISRKANRAIAAKSPSQYWHELSINQPGSHLLPQSKSTYEFDLGSDTTGATGFLEERFKRIKEQVDMELYNLLMVT